MTALERADGFKTPAGNSVTGKDTRSLVEARASDDAAAARWQRD